MATKKGLIFESKKKLIERINFREELLDEYEALYESYITLIKSQRDRIADLTADNIALKKELKQTALYELAASSALKDIKLSGGKYAKS